MVNKYKTFDGKRYELSIGGHGRKLTKADAKRHANLIRTDGINARIVNIGNLGWAVYTRKKSATTTVKKVKSHQSMGKYKETSINKQRKSADFRLLQVSPYVIRWKNGKTEIVTARALKKLQKTHTWATDF